MAWATLPCHSRGKHCEERALCSLMRRYYFCGSITIAWSFVVYFVMPTSPLEPGRFFNDEDRELLLRRFEENPYGKDRLGLRWDQFVEALLDWRTWVYFLMGASIYVRHLRMDVAGSSWTDLQWLRHSIWRSYHQQLRLLVSSESMRAGMTHVSALCKPQRCSYPAAS